MSTRFSSWQPRRLHGAAHISTHLCLDSKHFSDSLMLLNVSRWWRKSRQGCWNTSRPFWLVCFGAHEKKTHRSTGLTLSKESISDLNLRWASVFLWCPKWLQKQKVNSNVPNPWMPAYMISCFSSLLLHAGKTKQCQCFCLNIDVCRTAAVFFTDRSSKMSVKPLGPQ